MINEIKIMEIATKEKFKAKLENLIEQFSNNQVYYKSKEYKEDQLRQQFINPFFKALGWDMDNEQGFAPQYSEVIHEDRIRIQGKPKAPDYAFKVGTDRKFFVEAKASSIKIITDTDSCFQLRRYAWSAKLPVSILTDFEELAVYDTTIEPKQSDNAKVARINFLEYTDYLKQVDYLWDTFSKEAVWKGSFDKFAVKEKKGTQHVDKAFLKEIENWRDWLAKDIASNNNLDIHELNAVVQKFIDRIIFLRIAEDRGIETYETLKGTIKPKNTYSLLLKIFKRAGEKYNSGLFDFEKDTLSEKIKISDKVLDKLLTNIYYPKSPYEFSIIGVEILGSVYEQFLGKVIRLTRSGNAVIEEKPEVKKAEGVYYTPQYIVDYIVKNTVGELVKNKTPRQIKSLKIVDPACGSGSFLIGAYNYLLDWHLHYYTENNPEKYIKQKVLFQDSEGSYLLSTQEKKTILTNNIFGVDIDAQAVEVTKLSLALKMLEDENSETIGAQFIMFAERILPDLSSNIKCGNSLIGSDYYDEKDISLLDDEEIRKVNAFDWEKEFQDIFRYGGGFDAVIGNPPYIRIQGLLDFSPEQVPYLKKTYKSAEKGNIDIYAIFLEKALDIMNKNGLQGYILPHKFFHADFGGNIRSIIGEKKAIQRIINFKEKQIFENATTYTCLFFMSGKANNSLQYSEINEEQSPENYLLNTPKFYKLTAEIYNKDKWYFYNPEIRKVLQNLESNNSKLEDISKIFVGLQTSADKIYVLQILEEQQDKYKVFSKQTGEEFLIEKGFVKKFLMGKDIHRYEDVKPKNVVIFPYDISGEIPKLMSLEFMKKEFPSGYIYIMENKKALEDREKGKMKHSEFYAYIYPKNLMNFEQEKIIMPDICAHPELTLEKQNYYHTTTIYSFILNTNIKESYEYFLGVLNSALFWFFILNTGTVLRGNYIRFKTNYLRPFPIKMINWDDESEVKAYQIIVDKVQKLLKSKQELSKEQGGNKERILRDTIQNLELEINQKVYELYDLTQEDIKIIEGKSNKKDTKLL